MSLYTSQTNVLNDYALIKPLDRVIFYSPHTQPPIKNPPEWIPVFETPVIQPRANILMNVNNQGTANIPTMCPEAPIIIRNKWEAFNSSNPVVYGGFDKYNSMTEASCSERNNKYMTFVDSVNPFALAYVVGGKESPVVWQTHSN